MCRCEEYGVLEVQSGKEIRVSCSRKRYLLWKLDCMKSKASGSHAFSLKYSEGGECCHTFYLSLCHRKSDFTRIKHNRLKKGEIIGLLKKIALNAGL